jgi:preprotein translocase subunit SecG
MVTAISIIHIIASIALVLIVLLQTGRGSEIGAAFGSGASQTLFGSSGSSGFMTRLTTGVVVLFMITSLVLAIMYSSHKGSSLRVPAQQAPVEQSAPAPAAPAAPAPAAPAAPTK